MKKLMGVVLLSALGICGCSQDVSVDLEGKTISGTYEANINANDWGPSVDKVILTLDSKIDSISKDDLIVKETKEATDWSSPNLDVSVLSFHREITEAYLCDKNGDRVTTPSNYVAVNMYVSPNDGSPLLFTLATQYNTYADPYVLDITVADNANLISNEENIVDFDIEEVMISKKTDADVFNVNTFESTDGIKYQYASYSPENDSDVLLVWLHGLGEGGTENTDPYITTLGNKVTALVGDDFQNKFDDGVNILAPQCPTYWMDNDGQRSNFNNGAIAADGTSYYLESLHQLIEFYKKECNAEKVIIAGCSNGGYMTMLMAMNYTEEYLAYVPICEALPDSMIKDEQLEAIKNLPLYFIYSLDDEVVVPKEHEEPTIERLKNFGASNLRVHVSESVIDTSGLYKDDDGNPYRYEGHWSWIYFFNNEADCDETGISVWDWIAQQVYN
ncbi:MAG: hypothetical protein Q4B63_07235 [Clostridium perfringens]|nr:hypothetical protein [Clostridium perfringens]